MIYKNGIFCEPNAEEVEKIEAAKKMFDAQEKTKPKTDRQLIEELQTKQEDLTLRQEDIELMIADAIGGAI